MIKVENLVASYGDVEVLHGISLEVKEGEILTVMGQSGCGKTTFLRHLMGLQKPESGAVVIGDLDLTSMTEDQYVDFCRSVGVLFQSGALFGSLTIGDNVAFPLREHTTLAEPVISIMVSMKLQQVGLSGTEDMMPPELSGGMRKRAALARALIMDPSILLLDEPTTGLDPIIAAGIDELILRIRDAYHATMVVVAHDVESSMRIADQIAIFYKGRLLEIGTPQQIGNSSHPYVRQFLERRPDQSSSPLSVPPQPLPEKSRTGSG
jgi:phospholipid/cholesterol/gamma-HCH transport system ATP-binding protein